MTEEIKRYFNTILKQISGLSCILVTDRDGVILVKVVSSDQGAIPVPDNILKKTSSLFIQSSDQAGKLQLGKNKAIICMYEHHQLVQVRVMGLVVTFIGDSNCNTGHILSLESKIEKQLECIAEIAY